MIENPAECLKQLCDIWGLITWKWGTTVGHGEEKPVFTCTSTTSFPGFSPETERNLETRLAHRNIELGCRNYIARLLNMCVTKMAGRKYVPAAYATFLFWIFSGNIPAMRSKVNLMKLRKTTSFHYRSN
mgnify:FL=1